MRRSTFARRCITRIADLLGDEAVDQAIEEAFTDYGKDQDSRVWNIFLKAQRKSGKHSGWSLIAKCKNISRSQQREKQVAARVTQSEEA